MFLEVLVNSIFLFGAVFVIIVTVLLLQSFKHVYQEKRASHDMKMKILRVFDNKK